MMLVVQASARRHLCPVLERSALLRRRSGGRTALLLAAMLVNVSACGGGGGAVSKSMVTGATALRIPAENYGKVAWLSSEMIVIERHPPTQGPVEFELWTARTDGSHMRKIPLHADPRCRIDDVHLPYRLPDGGLGAVRECSPKNAASPFSEQNTLVAV